MCVYVLIFFYLTDDIERRTPGASFVFKNDSSSGSRIFGPGNIKLSGVIGIAMHIYIENVECPVLTPFFL